MWRKTVAGRGCSSPLGQLDVFFHSLLYFITESRHHQPSTCEWQGGGKRWKGYFHVSQPGKIKWECLPKKSGHFGFSWKTETLLFPLILYVVSERDWLVSVPMVFAYTKRNETLSVTFILDWWKEQRARQLPRGCFLSVTLNIVWEQSGCSLWAQAQLLETEKVPTTSSRQTWLSASVGKIMQQNSTINMEMSSKQGQLESEFWFGPLRERPIGETGPFAKAGCILRFQATWTLKRYTEMGSGLGP